MYRYMYIFTVHQKNQYVGQAFSGKVLNSHRQESARDNNCDVLTDIYQNGKN